MINFICFDKIKLNIEERQNIEEMTKYLYNFVVLLNFAKNTRDLV